MNDEMYKALSKGYIADLLQVNALELIETQQNSIMHRNDLLAELARNVEGLQAEVERLREVLQVQGGLLAGQTVERRARIVGQRLLDAANKHRQPTSAKEDE